MSKYNLKFTDVNVPSIPIDEKEVDHNSVDITLFGFKRLEYGERLNENFVHLLENFASLEDEQNSDNPDTAQTIYISPDNLRKLLDENKEVIGQLWYNKTNLSPYVFHSNIWNRLENFGEEIAANWGQIGNGEQIPQPVSESGHVFPYAECSWIVSPFNQLDELEEMVCRTDENAVVTMEYLFNGDSVKTAAIANYMIVGIKGNNNLGNQINPDPPNTTPTPTPSISESATPGASATPTPTPTPSESGLASLTLVMKDPYNASCSGTTSCTAQKNIVAGTGYEIQGGSGSYSYSWIYSSGSVFSISNPSIANPTLSRNIQVGNTSIGFGSLTVTDNITSAVASKPFTFTTQHIDNSVPDPSPSNTPDPTPTPSISESATPGASSTPTPTPPPSESATPTPSPSENLDGNVLDGIVFASREAPNTEVSLFVTLVSDGTITVSPGVAGSGSTAWIVNDFESPDSGADYTYEITNLVGGVGYTGPAQGNTGNLGSNLVFELTGNPVADINADIDVLITGPRGSSGTLQISMTIAQQGFAG